MAAYSGSATDQRLPFGRSFRFPLCTVRLATVACALAVPGREQEKQEPLIPRKTRLPQKADEIR